MLSLYLSILDTVEEKNCFLELYDLYRQDMYKTAYYILKNHHEAEDAVHEAFMIIMKNLNKINEINCPRTRGYLIIIVKNVALKKYNKNKKTEYIDDKDVFEDTDIEEQVLSEIGYEKISEMMLLLPENYYQILYLSVYMGFDIKEISENLGITYENAKKRLQRAKLKLKKMLEEYCDE